MGRSKSTRRARQAADAAAKRARSDASHLQRPPDAELDSAPTTILRDYCKDYGIEVPPAKTREALRAAVKKYFDETPPEDMVSHKIVRSPPNTDKPLSPPRTVASDPASVLSRLLEQLTQIQEATSEDQQRLEAAVSSVATLVAGVRLTVPGPSSVLAEPPPLEAHRPLGTGYADAVGRTLPPPRPPPVRMQASLDTKAAAFKALRALRPYQPDDSRQCFLTPTPDCEGLLNQPIPNLLFRRSLSTTLTAQFHLPPALDGHIQFLKRLRRGDF